MEGNNFYIEDENAGIAGRHVEYLPAIYLQVGRFTTLK
jgi:hypothetical protein